jgi:hypothetical protein
MTSKKVLAANFLMENLLSSIVGAIKASAFVFKYFECGAELVDVRGNVARKKYGGTIMVGLFCAWSFRNGEITLEARMVFHEKCLGIEFMMENFESLIEFQMKI